MKVRVGELDRKAASVQRAVMLLDIGAGTIAVHALRPDHFAVAERLAIALELAHDGLLDAFVVADKRLAEAASIEGLSVLNRELP